MSLRRAILGLAALLLAAFFLWPAPIAPVAWTPAPAPLLAPNTLLREAERLLEGRLRGPEDVAFDAQGRLYAATADGKVVRRSASGALEDFAVTGGRPLGLRFDHQGHLIVCDSHKGLLSVDEAGRITVLATQADGVRFGFTNNLDIAADDSIYFSDASAKYGQSDYLYDLLEARPHGRLLRYDRPTRQTQVLLRDVYFANGVALASDESFVLVNETYRYRIARYWLKGPKAGTRDLFADDLPGFPDNLDGTRRGRFWVALFTVRNGVVDAMHPRPWTKALLSKMPRVLWPKPEPYGLVLELNEEGRILRSLQDPGGQRFRQITTARERDGHLYLGTLDEGWIGKLALPSSAGSP